MSLVSKRRRKHTGSRAFVLQASLTAVLVVGSACARPAPETTPAPTADARIGLSAGLFDAGEAV